MADLHTRFAEADRIDAPDLWAEIRDRVADEGARIVALPAERRRHDGVRKALAVAAAIIVTVGVVSLMIRAFRPKPIPVGPGPSIFGPAHGMITYRGGRPGSTDPFNPATYHVLAADPASGRTTSVLASGDEGEALAWSPDGNTLLLGDGTIVHGDGSRSHLQVKKRDSLFGGSFSPDGLQVAYGLGEAIYVADISGATPPRRIVSKGFGAWWSPDGSVIAFETQSNRLGWLIETVRPDGTDRRTLLRLKSLGLQTPDPVAWSPDATRMAFSASHGCCQSSAYRIVVVDADGSNATLVTPQNGSAYPAWSPDGGRIAFVRGQRFFTMDPDGSNVVALPGQRVYNLPFMLTWNRGS